MALLTGKRGKRHEEMPRLKSIAKECKLQHQTKLAPCYIDMTFPNGEERRRTVAVAGCHIQPM
eukprot:1347507-Ditylum_brightwellii.AAC.1